MAAIITVPAVPFSVTVYVPPGVPLIVAGPLFTDRVTGKPLVEVGACIVNGAAPGVLLVIVGIWSDEIACDNFEKEATT